MLEPLDELAGLYRTAGEQESAGKTFRRIMYIAKREYGETDTKIAPYYRDYSDYLQNTGDSTLADSLLSLANTIAPLPIDSTDSAPVDSATAGIDESGE